MLASLLDFSLTLAATFAGAYFAFRWSQKAEDCRTREQMVQAGNAALLAFALQYTEIWNVQKQVIDPVREDPLDFIHMPPLHEVERYLPLVCIESLGFLAEGHGNVLLLCAKVQRQAQAAAQSVDHRSRIHFRDLQPAAEKAGVKSDAKISPDLLEEMIGQRLVHQLMLATAIVTEMVDTAVIASRQMQAELLKSLRAAYPGERFIECDPLDGGAA